MISNAQRILKLVRFFSILLLLHTTICPDTRYALADNKNVQIYLLRSRKRANLQTYFRFSEDTYCTCGERKSIINFMLRTPSTFSTVVQKILLARSTRFTEDWYSGVHTRQSPEWRFPSWSPRSEKDSRWVRIKQRSSPVIAKSQWENHRTTEKVEIA